MTTNSVPKPNPASRKMEKSAYLNLSKIRHLIKNFNIGKFYELAANEGEGDNFDVTDNIATRCILQKADDMSVLNCKSKLQERR
jgi:hypothetical protein